MQTKLHWCSVFIAFQMQPFRRMYLQEQDIHSLTHGSKLLARNTGQNGWTGQKDKGTKGQKDRITEGQQDNWTIGKLDNGTKG